MVSPACSPDCNATEPSCGAFRLRVSYPRDVAHDKDAGVTGELEIRTDADAVAPLQLDPERLDEAVRLETCAPDERVRGDLLAGRVARGPARPTPPERRS